MLFGPSNLKPAHKSLGFSSCLVLGFVSLVGVQTPVLSGQAIQDRQGFVERPVFQQPPSQVYRGNRTFQGQPIQGRIIQGQPIQGQPIQGQVVPNYQPLPTQIYPQPLPPITTPVPADNNAQKSFEAERAAYREAISKVKRLSEKNEALLAQNDGVLEQFETIKKENIGLVNRVGELGRVNENYEATVLELREKLATANANEVLENNEEIEQLRLRYRESVDQVKKYEAEIGNLTAANQNYQVKISELTAAQEAMELQAGDNMQAELAQKIRVLGDEKQSLLQQNESNLRQIQLLSQEKQGLVEQLGESQNLSERVSELTASNESYVSEIAALNARKVEVPPVVEPEPESSADVSSHELDIARLTRKNRVLTESNSELEKQNRFLNRQLGELEGQSLEMDSQEVVAQSPAIVKDAAVAALPVAVPKAGGSILSWLLPFLAIGLGIAFFVILREEIHKPPTKTGARSTGDAGRKFSQNPRRDIEDRN